MPQRMPSIVASGCAAVTAVVTGLADLVFPPRCGLCGIGLSSGAQLAIEVCDTCVADLPEIGDDVCLRCGAPQGPYVGTLAECERCPAEFGGIRQTVALGEYESDGETSLLRDGILRLKYRHGIDAAPTFGRLLADAVRRREWHSELDVVVPVPLHWRRYLARRFNQAELIADILAARLGLPMLKLLRRFRHTPRQMGLPRITRVGNVKGAFARRLPPVGWWLAHRARLSARHRDGFRRDDSPIERATLPLHGVRILLVDDILTTGATMAACARELRHWGAERVFAAVVARA